MVEILPVINSVLFFLFFVLFFCFCFFFQLSDNFREMVNIITRQTVRPETSVSIEPCFSDIIIT